MHGTATSGNMCILQAMQGGARGRGPAAKRAPLPAAMAKPPFGIATEQCKAC